MGGTLVLLAGIAIGVGIGVTWSRRRSPGWRRITTELPTSGASGRTSQPTPVASPALMALRSSAARAADRADRRIEFTVLSAALRDVVDQLGMASATLWRLTEYDEPRAIAAYPTAPPTNEPSPIVAWVAREGLPSVAEGPELAAPLLDGSRAVGALSVIADGDFNRELCSEWLPRHAERLRQLAELLEIQRESARERRSAQALFAASQRFQANRTTESLGAAILETALEVTEGARAALVRWNSREGKGVVQAVSPGYPVQVGAMVTPETRVGTMCRDGVPLILEDARVVSGMGALFTPGEAVRVIGSLAIVPLLHGPDVSGAIVVEGDEPGDVLTADARTARLLAVIAAAALETVWEIEEVTRRARTDQLTGLANRRFFDEQSIRVLAETDRFGGTSSLILADVDHFKAVNDRYGHDAGDAVLRHVAQVFSETVRSVDVCARYGGEEIAVLLPQTTTAGAVELAERLRRGLVERATTFGGRRIPVTASFGVASYPDSAGSREALIAAADRALYQAKADGRNRVKAAEPKASPTVG